MVDFYVYFKKSRQRHGAARYSHTSMNGTASGLSERDRWESSHIFAIGFAHIHNGFVLFEYMCAPRCIYTTTRCFWAFFFCTTNTYVTGDIIIIVITIHNNDNKIRKFVCKCICSKLFFFPFAVVVGVVVVVAVTVAGPLAVCCLFSSCCWFLFNSVSVFFFYIHFIFCIPSFHFIFVLCI